MNKKETEIYVTAYHADKEDTEGVLEKLEEKEFRTYLEEKRWSMARNLCLKFSMWRTMCNTSTALFGRAPCKSPGVC